MNFACENEARAAYEQFASEPHPDGFVEVYPSWEDLEDVHKQLWYRVATAAINGQVVENLAGKSELQVSGNAVCAACQKDCSLHKVNVPGKTGAGFDWLCPPEPVTGNTPRLSEAEVARNVLVLQQSGMSVKRIAAELNRSRTWVYAHLKLAKAGIASCREL